MEIVKEGDIMFLLFITLLTYLIIFTLIKTDKTGLKNYEIRQYLKKINQSIN